MNYNILHHLYISPLEACNLQCKMCYTQKSNGILTNKQILDFIDSYQKVVKIQTITFCGGEVFILPDFPKLINTLAKKDIFVQIITNGTIDTLKELKNPNNINIIVSLDGIEEYHDKNRSKGSFQKSFQFLQKAKKMGFHTEVFSIVTKENIKNIEIFEKLIDCPITYHPRKPLSYLKKHPISNIIGETKGFSFISESERKQLGKSKRIFPPLRLSCYQISLMSNGLIYGCCEGITPIGKISENPKRIIERFKKLIYNTDCIEPQFKCGLK